MKKYNQIAGSLLLKIREKKPLIHHITNMVVMNDTANVTLHFGALPVMAHSRDEVTEMTAMAGALVLNIGTLTKELIGTMMKAGKQANKLNIPIIVDPVGSGATDLRTQASLKLLKGLKIAVLRGNSGEIGSLIGAGGKVKGVESVEGVKNPGMVVQTAATKFKTVVIVTGKRDYLSDGKRNLIIDNGHQLLATNTGTGCMATTAIACFCAVEPDCLIASAAALACYGLAAEKAAKKSVSPASFKVALLDNIYNLDAKDVIKGARIKEING